MAAEQTEARPRVFISYSRVDSEFAYRLRADLEASGFDTWIDTAKLADQGGQQWLRLIQDAIDSSQAMVVVVRRTRCNPAMSTWSTITSRHRTSSLVPTSLSRHDRGAH